VSVESHQTYRTTGWATAAEAEVGALEGCQLVNGRPCTLLGVDDQVQPAGRPILRDMPRVRYSGTFDPAQVPKARPELFQRGDITNYGSAQTPKAAAFHHRFDGQGALFVITGGSSQFDTEEMALRNCNNHQVVKFFGGPCFLYAIGNRVVLSQRSVKPLSRRPRPR
jgi:hypothetical protein